MQSSQEGFSFEKGNKGKFSPGHSHLVLHLQQTENADLLPGAWKKEVKLTHCITTASTGWVREKTVARVVP